MKIFKYPIVIADLFSIPMPQGAEVLSVAVQRGDVFIWALVDENAEAEPRKFRVIGTGHRIESKPGRFIGTFQLGPDFGIAGIFVGHLFEVES